MSSTGVAVNAGSVTGFVSAPMVMVFEADVVFEEGVCAQTLEVGLSWYRDYLCLQLGLRASVSRFLNVRCQSIRSRPLPAFGQAP
jgi:hypothetical protein